MLGTFCPPAGVLLLQKEEHVSTCEADLIARAACGGHENRLTLIG